MPTVASIHDSFFFSYYVNFKLSYHFLSYREQITFTQDETNVAQCNLTNDNIVLPFCFNSFSRSSCCISASCISMTVFNVGSYFIRFFCARSLNSLPCARLFFPKFTSKVTLVPGEVVILNEWMFPLYLTRLAFKCIVILNDIMRCNFAFPIFPDWKMPSHFSRFSSPSGNPVVLHLNV